MDRRHSADDLVEILDSHQSLLDAGRENRHRAAVGWHPGGRVDEGPGDSGTARLAGRVHVCG